jgi:hypothetical protein
LVNLILAIVSKSYLEQQNKVEAENKEYERRKIEDELEIKNEESRKELEAHTIFDVENLLYFEDQHRQISYSDVSIEYEQNGKV